MTDPQKTRTFDECAEAAGKYLFNGRSVWTMKDMAEVTDYIRRLFSPLFDELTTKIEMLTLTSEAFGMTIELHKDRDAKQQATITTQAETIGRLRGLTRFAYHKENCQKRYSIQATNCMCGYDKAKAALVEQPGSEASQATNEDADGR